ncbi:MAG: hypothetical protein B6I36_02385 [Desulfobacteraceae bacterium 4572_35.1]|nr:MAG: hypothetical protein B6I36_02385 [Desulfobacteraceae bacterium 4572_35.1]
MARKPLDKLNGIDSRNAVWKVIRALRTEFTVTDVRVHTSLKPESVRDYMTGLTNAGYLKMVGKREAPGRPLTLYTLIKDVGIDAPRVRTDGTHVTQGQGNINLWRTMRILKAFTATELAIKASTEDCQIKENTAKKYCQALTKAKYLKMSGGKGGAAGAYRLMRHTGPKPPQIQRVQQIFDPNTNEVVWSAKGGTHE